MRLFRVKFEVDMDLEVAEYYLYIDRLKNKCYWLFDNTIFHNTIVKSRFDSKCRKANQEQIEL